MKTAKHITILDTTLRDGDQSPGFALSSSSKHRIALYLERLGVDIIEAGFPGSSQAQYDDAHSIASMIENSAVSVMARCIEKDIIRASQAIRPAKRGIIHLSIATSPVHREWKLGMSRSHIIEHAVNAVKCAKTYAKTVEMGAEDATRTEYEFLADFFEAVTGAGADIINISDTVGYSQPAEFARLIRGIAEKIPAIRNKTAQLSIHCHNDLGLATANTLAGIEAGATQAECTLLGIGERAGNAPLEEVISAITTRVDYYMPIDTHIKTGLLSEGARLIQAATGIDMPPNKAVVGRNAHAHASGIHQNGMIANPLTYSVFAANVNDTHDFRFVISRHSGTAGIRHIVSEITGITLTDEEAASVTETVKEQADAKTILSATDLISILNHKGLVNSVIWSVESCAYSFNGVTASISLTVSESGGRSFSSELTGSVPHDLIRILINRFFNSDISILSISFGSAGASCGIKGYVYLTAMSHGKLYHEERYGTDHTLMIAECLIDIINQSIFKEGTDETHKCAHPSGVD